MKQNNIIINYHNKKNNCIWLEGKVQIDNTDELQDFTCKISHNQYQIGTNNEANINISDNNDGFYNIQLNFITNTNVNTNTPFTYMDYKIPPYVWCIARGMMLANL